jgi:hypothetical protein
LMGVGLVFLSTPTGAGRGRRWSDLLPFGRRMSDRVTNTAGTLTVPVVGRRADDRLVAAAEVSTTPSAQRPGRRAED